MLYYGVQYRNWYIHIVGSFFIQWSVRLLGVLLLSLAFVDVVNAGFGITPPYVRNDRLTQGTEFTQEILLVRGDPVDDLKAVITVNVPGVEDWISIDRGNEFILPAGQTQVPMRVTVRVPNNAPYDRYTGSIRVRTEAPELSPGVSIALGAQIDVDLEVVDEILDFEVRRVQLFEAEEPRRRFWLEYPGKITFRMTLYNSGNAPVAPTRVAFDIYDRRGTVLLESIEHTNRIQRVDPFDLKAVEAYLPTRLPPGSYLVRYEIYLRNNVMRTGELTLSVLPEGSLSGYTGYGFAGLSLPHKLSLIVPPIVIVVLLIIGIILARVLRDPKQPKKRSRQHTPEYVEKEEAYQTQRTPGQGSVHRAPISSAPAMHEPRRPVPRTRSTIQHGVVDLSRRRPRE